MDGRAVEIEKLLYAYGFGKPPDRLELSGEVGLPAVEIYLPAKKVLDSEDNSANN
jgi:hypothetical protein